MTLKSNYNILVVEDIQVSDLKVNHHMLSRFGNRFPLESHSPIPYHMGLCDYEQVRIFLLEFYRHFDSKHRHLCNHQLTNGQPKIVLDVTVDNSIVSIEFNYCVMI